MAQLRLCGTICQRCGTIFSRKKCIVVQPQTSL